MTIIRELKAVEWIGETPPPEKGISYNNRRYMFAPVRFWGGRRIEFPVSGSAALMVSLIGKHRARVVDFLDPKTQEKIFYETLAIEMPTIKAKVESPTEPVKRVCENPDCPPDCPGGHTLEQIAGASEVPNTATKKTATKKAK